METLALVARIADLGATVALLGVATFGPVHRRIVVPLFVLAMVLPLLRLLLQAALLADGQYGATLPVVALDTRFGQVMLARAAVIALWLVARDRRAATMVLAILDIAGLALLGHGAASDTPLFGALVLGLHIGAAGMWLAGMAAALLGIVMRRGGLAALARFAPLGLTCVAVLAVSGLLNLQIAGGDILAAFAGSYGGILIAKLACFAAMLMLAAVNRFALLPRLDTQTGDATAAGHRAMLALAAETVLGAVTIGLAALLAGAAPGM